MFLGGFELEIHMLQLSLDCCCSVTQLCPTLEPHGLQNARPPCPSPSPTVCTSSYSLHRWCCPAISSSDAFFCPQYASGTFPMSQLFASGDWKTGASASTSAFPVNIQGWSFLRFTVLISLLSREFQESSPAPQFEGINSSAFCLLYGPALTTVWDHWEDHSLDYTDLCWQSDVSAFKSLSRFVIAFLPRSNRPLISWLHSPSAVILEPKKRKSVTTSTFSLSICLAVMGPDATILIFFNIWS